MTTTAPRIVVEFAGRRVPVQVVSAYTEGADGFETNVTCLHSRSGAVAYGAAVRVLWCGDLRRRTGRVAREAAEEQARALNKLGYVNVKVARN